MTITLSFYLTLTLSSYWSYHVLKIPLRSHYSHNFNVTPKWNIHVRTLISLYSHTMNVLTWSYHNYLVTVTRSSYCHINLNRIQLQSMLLSLLSLSIDYLRFLLHYHHTLTVNIIPLPYCPYYNSNYNEISSLSHGLTTVYTHLNITLLNSLPIMK